MGIGYSNKNVLKNFVSASTLYLIPYSSFLLIFIIVLNGIFISLIHSTMDDGNTTYPNFVREAELDHDYFRYNEGGGDDVGGGGDENFEGTSGANVGRGSHENFGGGGDENFGGGSNEDFGHVRYVGGTAYVVGTGVKGGQVLLSIDNKIKARLAAGRGISIRGRVRTRGGRGRGQVRSGICNPEEELDVSSHEYVEFEVVEDGKPKRKYVKEPAVKRGRGEPSRRPKLVFTDEMLYCLRKGVVSNF